MARVHLQRVNHFSKHKIKLRHLLDKHQLLPDGQYKQLKLPEQDSVVVLKRLSTIKLQTSCGTARRFLRCWKRSNVGMIHVEPLQIEVSQILSFCETKGSQQLLKVKKETK